MHPTPSVSGSDDPAVAIDPPPPPVLCSLVQVIADTATVGVVGELDAAGAPEVLAFLDAVLDLDCVHIAVDMSGVNFVGAAGLRALARAAREAQARGGTLTLVDARPSLLRLVRLTGLHRVLATTTSSSPADATSARISASTYAEAG